MAHFINELLTAVTAGLATGAILGVLTGALISWCCGDPRLFTREGFGVVAVASVVLVAMWA